MYKLLLSLFVVIISMSLIVTDAEARRFGGGKSFGQSRSFSNNGAYNASRMPPTAKPASGASKWLGPLAGLAAGGLLASLFMGNGLGSGILSWILIAAGLFIGWRLLSRFLLSNRSANQNNAAFQTDQGRVVSDVPWNNKSDNKSHLYDTSTTQSAPSGFDEASFLRQAKTVFIRLQAAYDNKNLADIREFTAPQVFAEVQMQIQERGEQHNQTDVITIDAALVDLDLQSNHMTASVRFTGLIREEQDKEPEKINEIWHFTKDTYSQNWLVVGIQQDATH
jgi:predicted lipid-binding transport protein (Tim44 family)